MDEPPPAGPPPPTTPIAMAPVPHEPPTIQEAARNTKVQILEDDGTETTESAYLLWKSPNVRQAYQKWPREQKPSQILDDGKGKIVWAKVLLRDMERTERVVFRRSKMNVAIKQLCRMYPRFRQGGEDPYAEISVMRNHGDHEHIFTCYEELQDKDHLYIVTLMARYGDLCYHIFERGRFRPRDEVPRGVAKQLLRNLEYLQRRGLVHRDLKPQNILVDAFPWFPIIDCAMTLQILYLEERPQMIEPQGRVGTPYYYSPEVYYDLPFDHKADVWAFGIILLNLLTGMNFWAYPRILDESFNFFVIEGGFESEELCDQRLEELFRNGGEASDLSKHIQAVQVLDRHARNLLQALLSRDPRNRPEVHEIINHPFFDGVN